MACCSSGFVVRPGLGAILMGFLSMLVGCAKHQKPAPLDETYKQLRAQAFNIRASEIGLAEDHSGPLAAVMELNLSDTVVTLVAAADGSTSLYFGSGGGVIGAGDKTAVQTASGEFLSAASEQAALMRASRTQPYPEGGKIQFFLIRTDGVLTADADEKELQHGQGGLSSLYAKGQDVITAIREAGSAGRG